MGNSLITKKKIAFSLKKLMKTMDFEKISIVDIMENADMRRQTFYSHFIDKYDLVEWIFKNDLNEQIEDNLDFVTGEMLLLQLAYFFELNRDFYYKIFLFEGQNNFQDSFQLYCQKIIGKVMTDCHPEPLNPDDPRVLFLIEYHSQALSNYYREMLIHSDISTFEENIPYIVEMIQSSFIFDKHI